MIIAKVLLVTNECIREGRLLACLRMDGVTSKKAWGSQA